MRLAIQNDHFVKVIKELDTSQIKRLPQRTLLDERILLDQT